MNSTERKTDRNLGSRDGATDTSAIRDKNHSIHIKKTTTMQITYNSYAKYDMALYFTLITLIDGRLAELETENPQLVTLSQQFHQSLQRYDTAYKQSTKSLTLSSTVATRPSMQA